MKREASVDCLRDPRYTAGAPLTIEAWIAREPVSFQERKSGAYRHLTIGDSWSNLCDCAWFRFTGTVPPEASGRRVALRLDVNGELLVVDADGQPVRGLTNAASTFDRSLGEPGQDDSAAAERKCARGCNEPRPRWSLEKDAPSPAKPNRGSTDRGSWPFPYVPRGKKRRLRRNRPAPRARLRFLSDAGVAALRCSRRPESCSFPARWAMGYGGFACRRSERSSRF